MLRWRNKEIKIIDRVCHKWKTIATLLSNKVNTVAVLSQRHQNNPSLCVQQVFEDYFISNKPPFGRYSPDWNGIIELLEDIEEEALSEEVREWLEMH